MAITLNHTIVPAHDKQASAKFFAHIFGLKYEGAMGHFAPVRVNETLTLDFDNWDHFEMHHYAFHVSDAEFDAIFGRIKEEGIPYGTGRFHKRTCKSTLGVAGAASISRIPTATYWSL
jgi:catechol 2,3-dioxygenase-like lactoylglutathione lyase family enzyme